MRIPLQPDPRNTSVWRHAQKKVLASLPLSDASDLSGWAIRSHQEVIKGAAMDSRGIDTGLLTAATRDGKPVARMTCPVDCTEKNKDYGRGWGLCTLVYDTGSADFRDYNRIAFSCYPDLPGFRVVTLCIYLYNEGEIAEPDDMAREGLHFVCLENHTWNTVYWEIPALARDKVYGIGFQYRMQGAEPGAAREVTYDFTDLRMEKVDADTAKGWLPKPHEIIFSHAGYMPGMAKTAIARGLKSSDFQVIRADDGLVLYQGRVRNINRHTGAYQLLDFSDFNEEGRFFLKAGADITRPFSISRKVWKSSVEKAFNFFFAERCGCLVPGIHDVCHTDFQCRHGDVTKIVNGGWHDAGDLSQGLGNTVEATYAMLNLSEKLRDTDPALYDICMEEARWGGDWVLKTRFSDGYRASWLTMDFWTKGFLGDYDDIIHEAARRPGDNMQAAAAEALGARLWKELDPAFARYNLIAAEEDFAWAEEDVAKMDVRFRRFAELGMASQGTITSIELFKATGKVEYLDKAEKYADIIPLCQQTVYPDWDKPLRGFFYNDQAHTGILHNAHKSNEQAPLVALSMIQKLRPKDTYLTALKLYGEYIKSIARFTAPYEMLPASIYDLQAVEDDKPFTWFANPTAADAREQIQNGVKLSDRYYLRFFPVWYSFRGNSGVSLTMARAALAVANTTHDRKLMEIVERALEWHVGRNPFNQSLIWGEGYNYTPQYTAMSGNIVGSFPVGVETQYNEDIPYYPHAACYNYKEVWVFPALRWLDIMGAYDCDL